jgi:anti-sigma factor RsiW
MSAVEHHHESLGAYALGVLGPDEAASVGAHLAECSDCRHELTELAGMRTMLDSVPSEAFLDGPPDEGALLLQRTLRRVRAEQGGQPRQVKFPAAAGVILIALATLGGGVLLGRQTAPGGETPGSQSSVVQAPPDSRNGEATNPATGASMAVSLTPRAGWVRVHAVVHGISAGEPCQLLVVSRDGNTVLAGSWLVSDKGARDGTSLDGSALIDPDQVSSVDVVTIDGRELISVSI